MAHAGRSRNVDYARWAKGGFLLGFVLFALGTGGEYVLGLTQSEVPDWIHVVLIDVGLVGILLALLLPIIFGIVLPLTE